MASRAIAGPGLTSPDLHSGVTDASIVTPGIRSGAWAAGRPAEHPPGAAFAKSVEQNAPDDQLNGSLEKGRGSSLVGLIFI